MVDPLNKSYGGRFSRFDANQLLYADSEYLVDENRNEQTDYTFGDPNFNFMQFGSNLEGLAGNTKPVQNCIWF